MDWKKLTALVLCLCLAAGLLSGCGGGIGQYEGDNEEAAPEEAETAEDGEDGSPSDAETAGDEQSAPADDGEDDSPSDAEEDQAPPEPTLAPGLGLETYDPDTVVAVIDGRDVTWQEYFYWLNYYVEYTDYLAALGMFSYTDGWDSNDVSAEYTNGQVVCLSARDNIVQFRAMDALADELGVTFDQDDQDQLTAAFETDADSLGDGDGECTQEEADAFEDYLGEQFMTRELYEQTTRAGLLLDKCLQQLYGENGADYPDDDTVAYAQEQGLMQAKHILLMTVDPATGEPLDDDEVQAKEDKINELYEQLSDVAEDPEALAELFDQLMVEHSEDGGVDTFPEGYLFGEGVMVASFEDTVKALEEYGLSEPVASDYGWHIILRLPIDPDGTALTADGQSTPVRAAAASAAMMERLAQANDALDVTWEEEFEDLDMEAVFGQR